MIAKRPIERVCHSAILHPMHLDRLGKCTHQFLPLNQTITAVRSVTERLKSLVEEHQSYLPSEEGRKARKRRKTDSGSGNDDSTNAVILTLSATAAFATVILSSFSAESVPKESQEELGTLLNDFSTNVVLHSLSKSFKDMSKNAESSSWTDEVAILANLRLRYALGLQRSPSISVDAECSSKLIRRMAESIEAVALPELRLEILRTLFNSMSEGQQPVILDLTLKILETTDISSGFSILHMVIQRWLPLIDLQASKEQLERFVVVLMNLQKLRQDESSAGILSSLALSSAEFWELQNVRNVLLAFIEQTTSVIDSWTTATLLQQQLVYSVFQTLLFVPTDYLSRPLRNSLVKRAILLDQAIPPRVTRDCCATCAPVLRVCCYSLTTRKTCRLIFICISNIYIKTMVL
ncbi:hypothetical protein BT96DRAFT_239255 [Gymnopus androsaceus JB14]|uniref:Uncharacterized protein n=1 Tax=Gymnopus androsaceus JB14 TaxID=1447944 RepID=A0A6A4ISC9_9AGAR|nr:hypothetical protein BT96DRAFT_239255 [Gymnopus androsaceus JB14]